MRGLIIKSGRVPFRRVQLEGKDPRTKRTCLSDWSLESEENKQIWRTEESRYPSTTAQSYILETYPHQIVLLGGWILSWTDPFVPKWFRYQRAAALPRLILSVSKLLMKPDSLPLHTLISIFQAAHAQLSWIFQQEKATHYML